MNIKQLIYEIIINEVKIKDVIAQYKKKYPRWAGHFGSWVKHLQKREVPSKWWLYLFAHRAKELTFYGIPNGFNHEEFLDSNRGYSLTDPALLDSILWADKNKQKIQSYMKSVGTTDNWADPMFWYRGKYVVWSFDAMVTMVKSWESSSQQRKQAKAGTQKVYEDENVLILHIKNEKASCYYGKGTKWCISATKTQNAWDEYSLENIFIFVLYKGADDKYALQFQQSVPGRDSSKYELYEIWDPEDDTIDLYDNDDEYHNPDLAKYVEIAEKYINGEIT